MLLNTPGYANTCKKPVFFKVFIILEMDFGGEIGGRDFDTKKVNTRIHGQMWGVFDDFDIQIRSALHKVTTQERPVAGGGGREGGIYEYKIYL